MVIALNKNLMKLGVRLLEVILAAQIMIVKIKQHAKIDYDLKEINLIQYKYI